LLRAIDADARIPAAVQALGPVTDRDVCVVDRVDGTLAAHLLALGGWIRSVPGASPRSLAVVPDGRADVVVLGWTGFRPGTPDWDEQLAQARRVLRPDGRLLVIHDYGRDEVTGLFDDPARAAERIGWSRPNGPFLGHGFRVRVLHCWWRWDTQEEATELLASAFGDTGAAVASGMRRPRLAWKVAVYHLAMGLSEAVDADKEADAIQIAEATKAVKPGKATKTAKAVKRPTAAKVVKPAVRPAAPASSQLGTA
jgi:hypothetical protein